jgi:hypothetical protein
MQPCTRVLFRWAVSALPSNAVICPTEWWITTQLRCYYFQVGLSFNGIERAFYLGRGCKISPLDGMDHFPSHIDFPAFILYNHCITTEYKSSERSRLYGISQRGNRLLQCSSEHRRRSRLEQIAEESKTQLEQHGFAR